MDGEVYTNNYKIIRKKGGGEVNESEQKISLVTIGNSNRALLAQYIINATGVRSSWLRS